LRCWRGAGVGNRPQAGQDDVVFDGIESRSSGVTVTRAPALRCNPKFSAGKETASAQGTSGGVERLEAFPQPTRAFGYGCEGGRDLADGRALGANGFALRGHADIDLLHQPLRTGNLPDGVIDDGLDFAGLPRDIPRGVFGLIGERLDFVRHDAEPAPVFAAARSLARRVQRQQLGFARDVSDDLDETLDLSRGLREIGEISGQRLDARHSIAASLHISEVDFNDVLDGAVEFFGGAGH
jgi:hypothetical protein